MTHIKQKGPECYLVTVAMLSGRPIEVIRKEANTIAKLLGVKRGGYLCLVRKGRDYTITVWRQQTWRLLEKIFTKRYGIPACPVMVTQFFAPIWMVEAEKTNLEGKGMVICIRKGGAHAMAYADGLIYDGNQAHPVTLPDWLSIQRGLGTRLTGILFKPMDASAKSLFFSSNESMGGL